jgi:DDE family transposase
VTNMSRPAERVVAFYNKRGTCEQWIKEGKGAIKWTRLWCRTFAANAVRLQLHALAYNLGNFLRTLATPEPIKDWSLTSLAELIKIGAKVVSHGRYVIFQMAEVTADRGATVAAITSASVRRSMSCIQEQPTEGVRANARENGQIRPSTKRSGYRGAASDQHLASVLQEGRENANIDVGLGFIWGISGRYALVWDHVNE